jgi:hypothetical protein
MLLPLGGCVVGMASGEPYKDAARASYTNFDRIDVSAGVEAVISQGPFDVKGEIKRGANFDKLIVEVKGDTLHISRQPQMWGLNEAEYRVTVSAPAYRAFDVSSGASLDGANLALQDVDVSVSSGARAELSGTCASLDVDVSSGARFDGESLRCGSAKVDASSGARADAFASQSADGSASSGARVDFHGSPAQFHEDSSSGGSVSAR